MDQFRDAVMDFIIDVDGHYIFNLDEDLIGLEKDLQRKIRSLTNQYLNDIDDLLDEYDEESENDQNSA